MTAAQERSSGAWVRVLRWQVERERLLWARGILGACLLFTIFTVYDQVTNRTGEEFLLNDQLARHYRVMDGTAIDPWQYRVLSELVVAGALRAARWLRLSEPVLTAFVAVRLAQNLVVFLLAAFYWRRLGVERLMLLVALAALAWGITYSGYASDLAFSTYSDLIFYLVCAILILEGRHGWVLPVVILAALNRETAGLIPALVLATGVGRSGGRVILERRRLAIAAAGFALYLACYGGLRLALGPRDMMRPYGHQAGLDMLWFNLTSVKTYLFGFSMMSVVPFIAFFYWRSWPDVLRRFFWALVPAWLGVHLLFGALQEARLLLVPHVLILMPAAFLAIQHQTAMAWARKISEAGRGGPRTTE